MDRPPDERQLGELRTLSIRALITATSGRSWKRRGGSRNVPAANRLAMIAREKHFDELAD